MDYSKALILGLLASDGGFRQYNSTYFELSRNKKKKYKRTKNVRIIEFTNTNLVLIKKLRSLLKNCYGYYPNIGVATTGVYRLPVTKSSIIDDILSNIVLGNNSWRVPNNILHSDKVELKKGFVSGFFDGDGSVDISKSGTPRIRITSTNLKGLTEIRKLLSDLNIKSSFRGPYLREFRRPEFVIYVPKCGINNFIYNIKSFHSKKKARFRR